MTETNSAALKELVRECRDLLEHELCDLTEELGPTLIDESRELSNTSRLKIKRDVYVHLHSGLTDHWSNLPPLFRKALTHRAEPIQPGGMPHQEADELANLEILTDAELTVQVAMREVVDHIKVACIEETNALERRISQLVLRNAVPHGYSAFRVSSVCACLETVCAETFPETDQRMLLIQLIGGHLVAELPQLYRAVNETLIDADILPQLKRKYRDSAPVSAEVAAAETAKMMGTLERLAKARTPAGGMRTIAAIEAGSRKFLDSLQTLQTAPVVGAAGAHTNVVRQARDSDAASLMRPQEAVALDIVSALFDLIFSDDHVSEGIKLLVGRLQVPVLKLAMLNQQFFANQNHPARRFLDSISGIAIRWGKFVDANDPFYLKLSELVERIQHTYDGDIGVFEAAIIELDEFIAKRDLIEAEANKAIAEAVRAREEEIKAQREGQLIAQRAADEALIPLLASPIPRAIEQFLLSYWRDVLQTRIFSFGSKSVPFVETMQIATHLVASVAPKKEAADQKHQVANLPALLKGLNQGLDEIGVSAEERREFMDTLIELCLAALRADTHSVVMADPKTDTRPPVARPAPTLQVSHATQSGVRVQDISLPTGETLDGENSPDRANLRRVRQLVRGDWVDFINGGQTRREHLTWINPSRSLLLFSNHAAECAISISPEALALRMKNQTVKLVTRDAPIFERALDGAVKSMDKQA